MFGDFKGHGFQVEAMPLQHFQRLSRPTLAMALLYVWFAAGSSVIKAYETWLTAKTAVI